MFLIFTTFLVINNLFFVFQESNESAQVRITDLAMITVSKEEHYIVIIFLIAVLIGLNLQPNCVLTSGTMLLWASTKSFKELLFIFILNLCRCLLKVTRIRLVGTGLYSLYVIITSNLNTIIERKKKLLKNFRRYNAFLLGTLNVKNEWDQLVRDGGKDWRKWK